MYKNHKICIVAPAYNEEKLISKVINSLPEFVDLILVVDDCSQDNTFQVVQSQSNDRIQILQTPCNQGVGGATIVGYKKALETECQIVVKMDGDGQMNPTYLPNILDAIIEEGYDYAKGNRFLLPEFLSKMPKFRLLGNIVLTFMTKIASGYWHIFDPQNGYTAIRTTILKSIHLDSLYKRYFFENDMLFHLNLCRGRVKDIPMATYYGEENSKMRLSKIIFTFPFLLVSRLVRRIFYKYIFQDFSPIALFLILGFFLFGWGFFFGLYIWYKAILTMKPTPTGTIMLVLLPLILGFQLILQAIVLDIQETPK